MLSGQGWKANFKGFYWGSSGARWSCERGIRIKRQRSYPPCALSTQQSRLPREMTTLRKNKIVEKKTQ